MHDYERTIGPLDRARVEETLVYETYSDEQQRSEHMGKVELCADVSGQFIR